MGRIVCVHGVGQQVAWDQTLLGDWVPALLDGLARASRRRSVTTDDVATGFYGDLFRPPHVNDAVVHNDAHAHAVTAYLTDRLTSAAIAGGLHAR